MPIGSARVTSQPVITHASNAARTARISFATSTPRIKRTHSRNSRRRNSTRLLLPLGEFDKATTRAHARRLRLPVHDKTESQDICFVEGDDYRNGALAAAARASTHAARSLRRTANRSASTPASLTTPWDSERVFPPTAMARDT